MTDQSTIVPIANGHGGKRDGSGRPKGATNIPERSDSTGTYLKAKAKREVYRAQMEELNYKAAIREMIPIAEVEQVIATAFSAIAQGIRSIPDHLERRTGCAPEIAEEVERLLDEEMTILADRLAVLAPPDQAA